MPSRRRHASVPENGQWLERVAAESASATGAPQELLGDFLPALASAARSGNRPDARALHIVGRLGERAAEDGVPAESVVQLYLSAAWRLWRALAEVDRPTNAQAVHRSASVILHVLDDAVSALVSGHQTARQRMIRHEQTVRQEFIDDLLRGDADVARMVQRAEPFGLDLSSLHHVALAAPPPGAVDVEQAALALERPVVERFGDRDVLVAVKDGRVVVLVPALGSRGSSDGAGSPTAEIVRFLDARLRRGAPGTGWTVAAGRAFPGAFGVARSYDEAREILELTARLHIDTLALSPGQLLVYRVLGRDQAAIIDLVRTVLVPLTQARGGAGPLVDTLHVYFGCADVATEAARRMHLSVRAVTYRLAKVRQLTGYDPTDADHRFVLHAAVLGARLLDWPAQPLSAAT
jgi:sugar diacid utilization regulator